MKKQLIEYDLQRKKNERVLDLGISMAQRIAGRFVDYRKGTASILFTRLCTTAKSISNLAPKYYNFNTHWDCVSLLSLTRNFIETYHTYFYFCVEEISQEEWEFRKLLFNLHDAKNRHDMFEFFGTDTAEVYEKIRNELISQIQGNLYFKKLEPKTQKLFLKGNRAFSISKYEIEDRIGNDKRYFRGLYKFLSNQTHTFPMSFFRMSEQIKGKGIESDIEIGYSMVALEISTNYFLEAEKQMLDIFPDIKHEYEKRIRNEEDD